MSNKQETEYKLHNWKKDKRTCSECGLHKLRRGYYTKDGKFHKYVPECREPELWMYKVVSKKSGDSYGLCAIWESSICESHFTIQETGRILYFSDYDIEKVCLKGSVLEAGHRTEKLNRVQYEMLFNIEGDLIMSKESTLNLAMQSDGLVWLQGTLQFVPPANALFGKWKQVGILSFAEFQYRLRNSVEKRKAFEQQLRNARHTVVKTEYPPKLRGNDVNGGYFDEIKS